MQSLGEKQRLFCSYVGQLLVWCYAHGYECTFGDAARSDEQAEINALGTEGRRQLVELLSKYGLFYKLAQCIANNVGSGIRGSLHELRLAIDLNLFINGVYVTDSDKYKLVADYWKSLNPLNCWGGDFITKDGNHFSMTHEGRK